MLGTVPSGVEHQLDATPPMSLRSWGKKREPHLGRQPENASVEERSNGCQPEPLSPHSFQATQAAPTVASEPGEFRSPHTILRSVAQRVSSYLEDNWSLRSTADTCDSTVLIEIDSFLATCLYG